jgi:ferrous iron transport protein B
MSESSQEYLIALAGNPNCGKSTLFNTITGARQHVGNYPGITVEKKEGFYSLNGNQFRLVDLPGTYSLTAYSLEELVARDFLVQSRPAVVVNIVDASNLERNLYLTVQLLELGLPVVVALNMVDVAGARGITIDAAQLAQRLGIAVVSTVARSGKGKEGLLEATAALAGNQREWQPLHISYGADIDLTLDPMEQEIRSADFLIERYPARWTALKYLEMDEQVIEQGRAANPELSTRLEGMAARLTEHIQKTLDSYPEAIIADHRYGLIAALLKGGVVARSERSDRLFLSDRLDQVLTNRFFGPLIMLLVLYGVYQLTFNYSKIPVHWLELGFAALSDLMQGLLPPGPLKSLVISGIINGIGGVLGFVPLILLMFLVIAFLEDTGYLARVAYMLDRIFRMFGLHGSSVMAYIISGGIAGGCAVPGVMATRTLRSSRERLATLLTAPFMNCGAKLPVFAMIIAAFFPGDQAKMMFILTLLSWCAALLLARLIRSTILRGPSTPFLLELPPYRLPTFKGLLIHTWERTWQYIQKAGTIILAISILLWALMSYPGVAETEKHQFEVQKESIAAALPQGFAQDVLERADESGLPPEVIDLRRRIELVEHAEALSTLRNSYGGRLGTALEGVSRWCGFDWRINIALLGGFAAKEVIISSLGTAYSLGKIGRDKSASLGETLAKDPRWNPLLGFAFIVFIMLYAPCFVTVTCIIKETGAWKWGVFSMVFNTSVAYLMAVLIYQGGRWLGWGLAL